MPLRLFPTGFSRPSLAIERASRFLAPRPPVAGVLDGPFDLREGEVGIVLGVEPAATKFTTARLSTVAAQFSQSIPSTRTTVLSRAPSGTSGFASRFSGVTPMSSEASSEQQASEQVSASSGGAETSRGAYPKTGRSLFSFAPAFLPDRSVRRPVVSTPPEPGST